MKYEVIYDCPRDLLPYVFFLKYSYKYAGSENSNKKIENLTKEEFLGMFPFAKISNKKDKIFEKTKEFPLSFFKKKTDGFWHCFENINVVQKTSGIFVNYNTFQDYIKSLIPGSFGLQYRFILQSPYFSHDDDEFYIIDNPVVKEKVWKVPMVRGSAWKGMLLKVASKKLVELIENDKTSDAVQYFQSVLRIFGTGSEEFRKVEEAISNHIKSKGKTENQIDSGPYEIDITSKLAKYALYELGINLEFSNGGKSIKEQIWEYIKNDIKSFSTKSGRGIFYPTYFDRLNLEVINPHNRNTKAGTLPIYFEVVPEGTEGIFQFIYIPHDGITLPLKELYKQMQDDYKFIKTLIKDVLEEQGIGSKSKYGWGKASIVEKDSMCYLNMQRGENSE